MTQTIESESALGGLQPLRATSRGRARGRGRWGGLLWIAPALLLLAVFVYYPLVQNLRYSLLDWDIFTGASRFIGLDNYGRLGKDDVFWHALLNNVWYAVVSVVVQVFGALVLAAMVESLRSERWRRSLRALYFVPSAISLTVSGLLFYFILQPGDSGLLNAALDAVGLHGASAAWLADEHTAIFGVIAMSQWQGFGYSALLFSVALQRIPAEIYEAAELDGVGPVRRFFSVSVPLVREMTGVMMIVTVSGAFQVFNEVTVMTGGGPNNSSQVLGTWLYHAGFYDNDFGYASAIATVIFVITLGLAIGQLWLSSKRRVEW